jgi:hypothetical protein
VVCGIEGYLLSAPPRSVTIIMNQNFKRGENMLANLTTDEKDAIKILDYWFIMEFLNQQSLKKYKEKETSALTYKKQLLEGRKKVSA